MSGRAPRPPARRLGRRSRRSHASSCTRHFGLERPKRPRRGHERVERTASSSRAPCAAGEHDAAIDARRRPARRHRSSARSSWARGPSSHGPTSLLALSFVPGRDGLAASYGGRTTYVTPDDLLAMQAYDHGISIPSLQIAIGLDLPLALARAAADLGVSVRDLLDHGSLGRFRVARRPSIPRRHARLVDRRRRARRRRGHGALPRARRRRRTGASATSSTRPPTRRCPATTGPATPGPPTSSPRSRRCTDDADLRYAALRAAALLRDRAMVRCGDHRCIGDDASVDVGSTALAVLAFVEIARDQARRGLCARRARADRLPARAAAPRRRVHARLRSRREPARRRPVPLLLGRGRSRPLARTHAPRRSARSRRREARARPPRRPGVELLRRASTTGARSTGPARPWTISGTARRASRALDFCLGWQAYGRKLMYAEGDTRVRRRRRVRLRAHRDARASPRQAAGPRRASRRSRPRAGLVGRSSSGPSSSVRCAGRWPCC